MVHVKIKAEHLFWLGPLDVTNSIVGAILAAAVLFLGMLLIFGGGSIVPGRVQGFVEFLFEFMSNIVRGQGGSRWRTAMPLIVTIFLFILLANWLGLLPGVGTIGYYHESEEGERVLVPFIRAAGADLNFTLGLAIVSFVTFIALGVRVNGVGGYVKELANPPYIAPIHVISELSRLISLSMRLFGNVFAGEVLLIVIGTIAPMAIFAFLGLELIFGAVQALVFALLTMTYIALSTAEHHGVEEHESAAPGRGAAPEPIAPVAG
ncbi:MAG: F0F1 ATP synthase subunit A [Chloroflexota bacterium]|nr:F0F1 ATP synthase subunit A [Chloroflexota bacterium]